MFDQVADASLGGALARGDRVRTIVTSTGRRYVTSRTLYQIRQSGPGVFELDATRMTMPELVVAIADHVDRPVIDKTGLDGVYRFKTQLPSSYSAQGLVQRAGLGTDRNGDPIVSAPPSGVSVPKSLETLGLRLEPTRAPIDVLVIDQLLATPTEN